jgi:hypothetical protein
MHALEHDAGDAKKRRGIPDSSVSTMMGALVLTNVFTVDISNPVLKWVVGTVVMGLGIYTSVRMYLKQ